MSGRRGPLGGHVQGTVVAGVRPAPPSACATAFAPARFAGGKRVASCHRPAHEAPSHARLRPLSAAALLPAEFPNPKVWNPALDLLDRKVDPLLNRSYMDTGSVLEIIAILERASIRAWLDGGWGVDALLGEQTRDHHDLDLIIHSDDMPKLKDALTTVGFQIQPGATSTNCVLSDKRGREVDIHPIEFDENGFGIFDMPDGRRWPFPPRAFAGLGRVGSRQVRCLSADAQVQCHEQGYEPAEKDLHDMERLQNRFGVVLPLALCRQPNTR